MPGEEITIFLVSMSSIPSLHGTACLPEQPTGCWDSWGSDPDLEIGLIGLACVCPGSERTSSFLCTASTGKDENDLGAHWPIPNS